MSLLTQNLQIVVKKPADADEFASAVLEMAMRGRLTRQFHKDESASTWLKKIGEEKAQLSKSGNGAKPKPSRSITENERPYQVPKGWAWSRLSDVTVIIMGQSPNSDTYNTQGNGLPFYQGKKDFGKLYPTPTVWCTRPSKVAIKNDILIAVRAPIGPTNICPGDSCIGRGLAAIRALGGMPPLFLFYLLRAFEKRISEMGVGGVFPAITADDLHNLIVPIPPLAEQHRIVEIIERFLKQTHVIKDQIMQCEQENESINKAALHRLISAANREECKAHWSFIETNFKTLYDRPENVQKLKQAILQLAVQGRLVPQDPQDEPASVLLQRIRAEKVRLAKEGKVKVDQQAPIHDDEIPYVIPTGWGWARFADVAYIASNLTKPDLFPDLPHIAPDNIEKGTGRLIGYKTVLEDGVISSNHHFYPNQILYSKIRPNLSKVVIVDFEGLCSADMYPIEVFIDRHYLLLYMLSNAFLSQAVKTDNRVAMPKINQNDLNLVVVAVPPLKEQGRIVQKVRHIWDLCDLLERNLKSNNELHSSLVNTILART